jgi:antitoxin component of RelBE/YafQ-DinJ toxin-antitoxin module
MAPEQQDEILAFRITLKLKQTCGKAADRSGLTLSDWCRAVLARAAHEGAFGPPKRRTSHGRNTER